MRRRPRFIAIAIVVAATLHAPPAYARQVQVTPQGGIIVNFQNAELALVLQTLARSAGFNVFTSDLPSKLVTLNTQEPLTRADAEALIRSLAESNGITVAQVGNVLRLQGTPQQQGPDARQLYIYRLKHARAPVLAQTLQALFGGAPTARPGAGGPAGNTLNQQLRQLEIQAQQQQRPGQAQPPVIITGAQLGRGAELEGNVQIVPDELTNSLLIRATPADWQVIQQAMLALDLRPLQVVIEVVIAEVRRSDDLNIGTTFGGTDTRARPGEATTGGLTRQPTPPSPGEQNFTLRLVRTGNIDFEAALSALAASGNARILSRPVVLAQNNQQANITVGEQRPFISISRSSPIDPGIRDESIQFIPVATELTIVPTINSDGYVNLTVEQQVNSATNEIQFGAPVISTRSATTQLLARNGQTVVIGGLVDRQTDRQRSGIPFLKDIPVLGFLFGSTREMTVNSELFLFLTPYIVETDEDADRVREEIERKTELLGPIVPIQPIVPPVIRPDTIRPDTLQTGVRR